MTLTLEQEAYYLYLESRYNFVVVLPDNVMYGADTLEDSLALLSSERDYVKEWMPHGAS
jgi:hypothetical protein